MSWTRRRLLAESAMLALVAVPVGFALGCNLGKGCVDPDRLTTGQASLRASLNFTEASPHGSPKECAGCEFFAAVAGESHDCGECRLVQGPVNARGYCDSWSPRAV